MSKVGLRRRGPGVNRLLHRSRHWKRLNTLPVADQIRVAIRFNYPTAEMSFLLALALPFLNAFTHGRVGAEIQNVRLILRASDCF